MLLHSGGMTGLVEFEEQVEFFTEKQYKVIRPDLRGHGESGGTLDNYFLCSADDLNDTLEHLQINSCHIAGVSLGGIAALLFAKKYPDKVRTLKIHIYCLISYRMRKLLVDYDNFWL